MEYFLEVHREPKWLEKTLARFGIEKRRVSNYRFNIAEDLSFRNLGYQEERGDVRYIVIRDYDKASVRFQTYPIWGLAQLRFQDTARDGKETILWTDTKGQIYSGHFLGAGPYNTFSGKPEKVHPKYYQLAVDHVGDILDDPLVRDWIESIANPILRPLEVTSSSI